MISFIYKDISKKRIGGAVIAGRKFKNALMQNNIKVKSMSYTIGNSNFFKILKDLFLVRNIVIWNISTKSLYKFIFILFLSVFFKKKIIIRFFGSDQIDIYNKSYLNKILFKILFKMKIFLMFETIYCYDYFSKFYNKTFFLPNFIKINNDYDKNNTQIYNKKFIYVGTIAKDKGVDLILKFLNHHPDYSCDFYGLVSRNYKINNIYKKKWKESYKGTISNKNLLKLYRNYDFTILPSSKEGYPSIVLESLNEGTPLILSRIPSLTEMIKYSAIFVDRNYNSFEKTILNIKATDLFNLKNKINLDLQNYDSNKIITKFIKEML